MFWSSGFSYFLFFSKVRNPCCSLDNWLVNSVWQVSFRTLGEVVSWCFRTGFGFSHVPFVGTIIPHQLYYVVCTKNILCVCVCVCLKFQSQKEGFKCCLIWAHTKNLKNKTTHITTRITMPDQRLRTLGVIHETWAEQFSV